MSFEGVVPDPFLASPDNTLENRGFGHASVLKTFAVDLRDVAGKTASPAAVARLKFCNVKPGSWGGLGGGATKLHEGLGWDGLPVVGSWVNPGDPLYCVVDELTGKVTVGKVGGFSLPSGMLPRLFLFFTFFS